MNDRYESFSRNRRALMEIVDVLDQLTENEKTTASAVSVNPPKENLPSLMPVGKLLYDYTTWSYREEDKKCINL